MTKTDSNLQPQNSKFAIVGPLRGQNQQLLFSVAKAAFSYLKKDFEVNLRFVSATKIKELNRIYRGKNVVTDVLSFKLDESEDGGDVVICLSVAKNQAKAEGTELEAEVAFLLAHGILHLSGYDHEDEAERGMMEGAEDAILKSVKIEVNR